MLDIIVDKKHDEIRQGEAFAPLRAGNRVFSKKFYIESYGCQMNFADSEVVASILQDNDFGPLRSLKMLILSS